MDSLKFTGERLTTELGSVHGVIEHLHRYAIAQKITKNKIVLDIASGEGYGSYLLSKESLKVYGVDIDEESVVHARNKYSSSNNLEYLVGSTDAIPLPDNSVDVVVSFETIEHIDKHDLMMQEISRVLKEDGMLLISSPEKSIYSQRDPNNPFHIKELTLNELKELLNKYFKFIDVFSQRFVIGSLIHLNNEEAVSTFNLFDGNYSEIKNQLSDDIFYNKPFFNMAICSNIELKEKSKIGFSFFNGVDVVKREISSVKNNCEQILNSESYKIGNSIVKKLKLFKKK